MRVGVDATGWPNRRGSGRVVRSLLPRLVRLDPGDSYTLFIDDAAAREAELPPEAQVRSAGLRRSPAAAISQARSRRAGDVLRLARMVRRESLDVFLAPAVDTWFPVRGVPVVLGVHDATAAELPELVLPSARARLLWRLKERDALRTAHRMFTPSESARAAIAGRLGVPAGRLTVIRWAADPAFTPPSEDAVARAAERVGLGAGEPYLVYAAGINPHKGLDTLLAALAGLAPRPRLVVAGAATYVSALEELRRRVADLGLERDVLLPGFLPDAELAALYGGAVAAVVPSRAEGFGLPAVEAAACGAATVLSDIGPHRETLAAHALRFPPGDARVLRAQLARLLADPGLRRRLAEAGRQAVSALSWDVAARRLRELLLDAAGQGHPLARDG
jgi:glycosyltransferase involved in cell wall biosynthesis